MHTFGPAKILNGLSALLIIAVLFKQLAQIHLFSHRGTVTKKIKKQPKDMTSDELARHVFHPKVLKAAKKHIAKLNAASMRKA